VTLAGYVVVLVGIAIVAASPDGQAPADRSRR
jgi:hypothetical protein